MKKLILITIASVASVFAFAQGNKNVQSEANGNAQQEQTATVVNNFTSFGNNWVEAGLGFAFQTDTGLIGYAKGNYNIFNKDTFNVDVTGGASYMDMHNQVFNLNASIVPSYKLYTYKGIDITFYGNVDMGYGTFWVQNDGYSHISYAIGAGVEFAYQKLFVKPFYNWVNYELFSNYDTVRNHVVGVELGLQVTDNIATIASYSHWFVNANAFDNEDRMTIGVRYLF